MKYYFLAVLLSVSFFFCSPFLNAFSRFVSDIPNGSINSCANCHINPGGGGPRNDFGQDFDDNGQIWDSVLANMESDLDGVSNGEELQDLDGTWREGDPDPGEPCLVSNPGDGLSLPTPAGDITLDHDGSPVPAGTNVEFTADLFVDDCYVSPQTFDVWIDATLFNGQPFAGNPVFGPMHLTLPPGFSVTGFPISIFVPPVAPAGIYRLTGKTGNHPDEVFDESWFEFEVVH